MARPSSTPGWVATGNTSEPSPGRKSSGWLGATSGTPGDKPPAQEFNWFWSLVSTWLAWLNSYGAARISSFEEATGWGLTPASSPPAAQDLEPFLLDNYEPSTAPLGRDGNFVTEGLPTITVPTGLAADGRCVWVCGDTVSDAYVIQLNRNGIEYDDEWQLLAGDSTQAISSSGRHVAVARTDGGVDIIYVWKIGDKQELTSARTAGTGTYSDVDIIGESLVACEVGGIYYVQSDISDSGTKFSHNRLAQNRACAGYGDRAVVVGVPSGTGSVADCRKFDGTALWGKTRSTGLHAVCTDGEFFYLGGEQDSSFVSIHMVSMLDGRDIWTKTSLGTITQLAVDDRYLYAVSGSSFNDLIILDKRNGAFVDVVEIAPAGRIIGIACDGDRVYTATDSNEVHVLQRNKQAASFVYIDPNDDGPVSAVMSNWRRPFHNVVLPGE